MIGVSIATIRHRDRLRPRFPNQLRDRARVRWIAADITIRQAEVVTPSRAKNFARRLGLLAALLGRAVGAELATRQITQADLVAQSDVLGDRSAEPDFEIVRVRAEDEQINSVDHASS